MAKTTCKSGSESTDYYVRLNWQLLDSMAWNRLSLQAQWIYTNLKRSFNSRKGGDNHLILPYSKIVSRMSRSKAAESFRELIDLKFIKEVQRGGLLRNPSIYALTDGWKKLTAKDLDRIKPIKKSGFRQRNSNGRFVENENI